MRHDVIDVGHELPAEPTEGLLLPNLIPQNLPPLQGVELMACGPAVPGAPSARRQVRAPVHRADLEPWHELPAADFDEVAPHDIDEFDNPIHRYPSQSHSKHGMVRRLFTSCAVLMCPQFAHGLRHWSLAAAFIPDSSKHHPSRSVRSRPRLEVDPLSSPRNAHRSAHTGST